MDIYYEEPENRIKLYRIFSSLFIKEPTDKELIDAVKLFEITTTETGDEIRADYIQLFSNYAGQLLPYESLYNYEITDIPKVWGNATIEVQKIYRSANIIIDEDLDIVPDHISAELLFMSYLIENELVELQAKFLSEHLCLWIPYFCNDIMDIAMSGFYRQVAAALKAFIISECDSFEIPVEE